MAPPGAVVVDFGPDEPRTSDEYEQVSYPPPSTSQKDEATLPLFSLHEDNARRRGPKTHTIASVADAYDDEGKDGFYKARSFKPYQSSGRPRHAPPPPPTTIREFLLQNLEHVIPMIYTLLSCWTRFHKIGRANNVIWDEAHFGKFGSHYLKREFYFDVHPPLGKMIVGFVGLLSGYDGNFEFKSGAEYPDSVPFVAMRVMLATFGVAMVPLGWYTAVELGMSQWACHLVALMVLLDVGWLCISRFILLDSMLLCFIFLTVFCMTKFHNQQYQPFSFDWWAWLSFTGVSIGLVTSVKMVGLFVTALVGLYTVEDLWEKFGDVKMSLRDQIRHWVARVVCLIILPIIVFMATFKLHFMVLNGTGPGDAQMSSLFQANLVGNNFAQNPLEVAIGSKVTIKNYGYGGGLLHSHVQTFPVGSMQQQVTFVLPSDFASLQILTFLDAIITMTQIIENWNILPPWAESPYDEQEPIRFLKHGDTIRLSHDPTGRNLHSHLIPAPVTKLSHEVSAYGNLTVGDIYDSWTVEVVDDILLGSRAHVDRIHSLTTRLRFRHNVLGCYLRAANAILPQWGFKQIEVNCVPENNAKDTHTYWNIESHWNSRLPAGEKRYYRSPFLRDFWHLNVAMMTSNNALIPDPDKEDILSSQPFDWPFLHLGLRMCGWGDTQTKYYLMGTPIIWWAGTVSLFVALLTCGVYVLRIQRKFVDMENHEWEHFLYVAKVAFFGWCFHFVPFLIMGRVTYLHHYLPTLYFSVLMVAHLLDHFVFSSRRWSMRVKIGVFGFCAGSVLLTFWWFKGVAFGIDGPIQKHKGLLWRESWNIYTQ
ncbi:unnamed protein product [Mycena citricolor]|uniref:Dolichyl-phosphate-mannose--protein mannosyltransferase n=1 Tax=Mycena citricolor TaxID=2018698 RepID=A0AAD2H2A4_9AGAR|nr:unnamed protein product [Mycena citricolor]